MQPPITLGSLFDGIGGFPLAGIYAGMKPVWASEIEPFPIRVTTVRFPDMKHYGDIHALKGGELEPVDVITFGSPCTDLSVAGRRSGLGGKQSSLFFEAIRIITEMREMTNGTKPRWLVWENVPGALSSTNGNDFRTVLESLVRVKDAEAVIPMPDKGKWLSAGETLGNDYSLAWRIIDASKGWGVAQRRRRVFVVVDLDGQRAGQVLFESEGMSGYTPPCSEARQGTAGGTQAGAGAPIDGGTTLAFEPGIASRYGGHVWDEVSGTLRADMGDNQTCVALDFNPTDSRIKIKDDDICQTLTSRMGTGGNTVPLTLKIRSGCTGGGKGALVQENLSATLGCNNDQTLFTPKAYGICSDQSNAMLSENPYSGIYEADTSRTLDCSGGSPVCKQGGMAVVQPIAFTQNQRDEVRDLGNQSGALSANPGMKQQTYVAAFMGGQGEKAGGLGYREEQSPTLKAAPSGGNTAPDVVYALQGNMIGRKDENGPQGDGINEQICFTLNTVDRPAVAAPSYCMTVGGYTQIDEDKSPTLEARDYKDPHVVGRPPDACGKDASYLVRRLTPDECCRLQGYPDGWTEHLGTAQPTDAELRWWTAVFEDWYRAQGKAVKPPSVNRLRKWLNDPRTDAAEYKAYGNSVAVPCVFFILAGIVWADERRD